MSPLRLCVVAALVILINNAFVKAAESHLPTSDDEALASLDLDFPGMEAVKSAAGVHDLTAVKRAYLDFRRTASRAKWKIMPADQPATAVAAKDAIADDVVVHRIHNSWYDAMVPKVADMGADFDWFHNPLPPSDPNFTNNWMGCVISRTQFWEQLGTAYWKTRDEKYARAWVEQLQSFAAKVPVDFNPNEGVNYHWSPLSAAVRMQDSWPFAYYHFRDSPSFTPAAQWAYLKEIRDHARILIQGLTDTKRVGNWITAECSGLYTLATLFPELKESAEWRKTAIDRFVVELDHLVPPDGFEAELTPGYHTSTIEEFSNPVDLAALNNQPIPDIFRSKLLSMYRAMVMVMDQSGNLVPTNDSWIIDATKWAARGLKLGDDPLLRWAVSGGADGIAPPTSTMLPYAGFYAMRGGWKRDDMFLFFRAGPSGIGHVHEEDLEITLRAWEKPLLIDPGTYSYDKSESRRYVMGTSSHSTVLVDGNGQHRGDSKPPTAPVANPWQTTPLFDFVAGTYDAGYQANVYAPIQYSPFHWQGALDKSISHTRRVLFLKPYYVLIVDSLDGTGQHTFDSLFQLDAPAARVDPATQAVYSQRDDGVQLVLYPLERTGLTADVVQGQKDPMLGWYPIQKRTSPTARFHKQQEPPALFATFLYPYRGEAPTFATEPQHDNAGFWMRRLHTAHESIDIGLALDNKPDDIIFNNEDGLADILAHASGMIIRRPTAGGQIFRGGWNVTGFRDSHVEWTSAKPATLLCVSDHGRLLFYNAAEDQTPTLRILSPFPQQVELPPQAWTLATADGAKPATAPQMFAPLGDAAK